MCSGPNPAYAASSLDPSTPTYINTERSFIFLESASKIPPFSCLWFCYNRQSVVCRSRVVASFLDKSKRKNPVVAQQLIADVGAGHRELVGRIGRCRSDMKVQLKFNFLQNRSPQAVQTFLG